MNLKIVLLMPFFFFFQRIKLPEYDVTFIPANQNEFRILPIGNDRFLKIHLFNTKGKMSLECYNSADSSILEKGNYIESLDLLKTYSMRINATSGIRQIEVVKYFQPLRHGKWEFYKNSKLEYYITYNKGIKTDSFFVGNSISK